MRPYLYGCLAVVGVGALFYLAWQNYREFLTQGQRPSASVVRLNQLEKTGVPDIELELLDGKRVRLSDFDSHIVVLNFWASWCAPCVQEFPSLQNLARHFKGQVVILAVSGDSTREDLDAFLTSFGGVSDTFLVSWDKDRQLAAQFGTEVLPESYIIGPRRKLIRKITGVDQWDSAEAIRFFTELTSLTGEK